LRRRPGFGKIRFKLLVQPSSWFLEVAVFRPVFVAAGPMGDEGSPDK
jgi:hypothetical protein